METRPGAYPASAPATERQGALLVAVFVAVGLAVFVAVLAVFRRYLAIEEHGVLFLGVLGKAEPQLRHGEPVGLCLKRRRFLRELEAPLRSGPEFFRKFHGYAVPYA